MRKVYYTTPALSSFMTYQWVCNKRTSTGATFGTGTAYPSGVLELTAGF